MILSFHLSEPTNNLSIEEFMEQFENKEELDAFLKKLDPEESDRIKANPEIQGLNFLYHVARGEQDQAERMLTLNPGAGLLLQSMPFTDYSGRKFNCTAYQYAYWAKDTHMCRMLEKHMVNATKLEMFKYCDDIERHGLSYIQDGTV